MVAKKDKTLKIPNFRLYVHVDGRNQNFSSGVGLGAGVLRYISKAKLLRLKKVHVLLAVHVGQTQTEKRLVAWNITKKDLVSLSSETQGRIVGLGGGNGAKVMPTKVSLS